jgi:PhnB protein
MASAGKKNIDTQDVRSSIAPWLSVGDSVGAVNFYKSAFNAIEVYRLKVPDGVVSRLSVDGAEFWVSQDDSAGAGSSGGGSVRMILTTADPDMLFTQALKAGAKEVFPVGVDHGWKLGRLSDPFGFDWEIGHQLLE